MPLFAYREIQRRLDELSEKSILNDEQLKRTVENLNRRNRQTIDTLWEVSWVSSIARLGVLTYEGNFGGTRHPDIHFKTDQVEFVADIATVSDKGLDERNPIYDFFAELDRLYRKHKVFHGFSLKVGSKMVGEYGDSYVQLALPPKGKIQEFTKNNFEPQIAAAAAYPRKSSVHTVELDGGKITLSYNADSKGENQHSSYTSFQVAYSVSKNPVANALRAKREQLKKSGFGGIKGIILCDGDCRLMKVKSEYGRETYGLKEIFVDQCANSTTVDFILTVSVADNQQFNSQNRSPVANYTFWSNPQSGRGNLETVKSVFAHAKANMPDPLLTPLNAIYRLERKETFLNYSALGQSQFSMGGTSHDSKVSIPARVVLGLLAGEISLEDFKNAYNVNRSGGPEFIPLQHLIKSGSKLKDIELEVDQTGDCDQLKFTFGPYDPANGKYVIPKKQ